MKFRLLLVTTAALAFLAIVIRYNTIRRPHDDGGIDRRPIRPRTGAAPSRRDLPPSESRHGKSLELVALLRERVGEIAKDLPDLETASLESALRKNSIRPRPKNELKRDASGRVSSVLIFEPKTAGLGRLFVSDRVPSAVGDKGFFAISSTLLEVIHDNAKEGKNPAVSLCDLIGAPDSALGDSQEARSVMRVARWEAAIALRRIPLAEEQVPALAALSIGHPDPVLRGALAGALLANREKETEARNWLSSEGNPRAVEAFLVELVRKDRTMQFPPSSEPTVLADDGELVELTLGDGYRDHYQAISGKGMFDVLATHFLQKSLEMNTPEVNPTYTTVIVEGKAKVVRSPLDGVLLLIEAMRLRAHIDNVPMLQHFLGLPIHPEYKARVISILGETSSPSSVPSLCALAMSGASFAERKAAINGLTYFDDPSCRNTLEKLLWESDIALRGRAARSLFDGVHRNQLSQGARTRIIELSKEKAAPEDWIYGEFARWLSH